MSMEDVKNRGLGYVADPEDNRDLMWRSVVAPHAVSTPDKFKLTALGPVMDQGSTSQCVAYSMATVKMHQEFKEHKKYYSFDPSWLYELCKQNDGIPDQDGTFIRVALGLVQDMGYLAKAERYKLKEDTHFRIDKYVRLTSVQQIKEAIYHVGPVVFGIMLDEGVYKPDRLGVIPEPNDRHLGGHAMTIVGWDDSKRCQGSTGAFLVKNSWGTDYGKKGYVWYPYTHFDHYEGWDAWRVVDAAELLETGWDDDGGE